MPRRSTRTEALTQDEAMKLFAYDPITGKLTRAVARGARYKAGDDAGSIDETGYRRVRVKGVDYYAHRLIWLIVTGNWPTNTIDHRDHNKLNNRFSNLRDVTHAVNMGNFPRVGNTGLRGITKVGSKFQVTLWLFGKTVTIGRYKDIETAELVSEAARDMRNGFTGTHTAHPQNI